MRKHHPYQNIIEDKLEQLPTANADLLWNEMHSILDKKMPQKKERRRFIFWFFASNGFLLLSLGILTAIGILFFLSTKESPTATTKKLPSYPQPGRSIEDGTVKISQEHKENITATIESDQKKRNSSSSIAASPKDINYVNNNNFIETVKQSKEDKTIDLTDRSIPVITNDRSGFDIATTMLDQEDLLLKTKLSKENSSITQQPEPTENKMRPNRRNNNKKEFYGGITSGVDLSSIHLRSLRQGVTKGLIIGYAFNQKWSIESGLLWDTKRVYDNGTYFNPPGYTPTNGIKITAVNGKSRLTEWPINIKYTIISGKHNLFASAGISSYIMRSENYDYLYTQNNQPAGHNYLSYSNQTKNWFSVVNFSIGYTHKIGEIGNIRVEPYIKLPVKNIGIGKMPIMSSGLNIGFTKTLK